MRRTLSRCLETLSSWNGLINFIFSLLMAGQFISFLKKELNGFLFVTLYFGVFPICAIVLLLGNILFSLTRPNKTGALAFSILLATYLLILWKLPLAGSFVFFFSDYSQIHWLVRLGILLASFSAWLALSRLINSKINRTSAYKG